MPVKVYITIDTEEDQWGDYNVLKGSVENVSMIPVLQELFDRYGAVPTYLLNYPVAVDDSARRILERIHEAGRCGIGTHCHPWNTPPLREKPSRHSSMLCNLPEDLMREKMETLHRALADVWGVRPQCFRAGRWGFGESVARCIHALGYRVDTSITPFSDWSEYGGPDFTKAAADDYLFTPESILSASPDGPLLEVPPTIGFLQSDFRLCSAAQRWIASRGFLNRHVLGLLDRMRLLNFRWLSPELCCGEDMVSLARTFVSKGYRFLNMSFHSPSLVPGLGPFVRSKGDLGRFLQNTEAFLSHACASGFQFVSLDKAVENGRLGREPAQSPRGAAFQRPAPCPNP